MLVKITLCIYVIYELANCGNYQLEVVVWLDF